MVGEIRDEETAKIAVNSAMTGHLVLSTLHTNDAATALPRLSDMGIQPFLVSSTINIVIAQRLVRKICEKCKANLNINDEVLALIRKEFSEALIKKYKLDDPTTVFHKGQGCKDCQNTGYKGRVGIYEILTMNEDVKQLIMAKSNASKIKQLAVSQGMSTMIDDGIAKVLAGLTTIEELLRVSQE